MMQELGLLGEGAQAARLCASLAEQGWRVRCWPAPLAGGEPAATPAEAVAPGGLALSLLDGEALLEHAVTAGDGLVGGLGPGGVHLLLGSAPAPLVRRLAAAHEEHGSALLAAHLAGEPPALAVSGAAAAKRQARRLLAAIAAEITDLGPDPAAAMLAGAAAGLVACAAAEALAQALELAARHGLAPDAMEPLLHHALRPAEPPCRETTLKTARRALALADEAGLALPLAGMLREQALRGR
ncbi:hypothetical protein SH611_17965 [Geminicoccaceae bacterium 1502E]|nr:hypothetical protein [Geminicoccaceae bacterium 1502E]